MIRIGPQRTQSGEEVPTGMLAKSLAPEIVRAAMEFSRITYLHSALSLREFEAARMITAEINGCIVCRGWRSADDLPSYLAALGDRTDAGILASPDQPDEAFYTGIAQWRSSSLYSPRERLAIELAGRMGTEPKVLAGDDEFWRRFKAQFSDVELVDLSYCIACWMGLGRVGHVLGLDTVCNVPQPQEAEGALAG